MPSGNGGANAAGRGGGGNGGAVADAGSNQPDSGDISAEPASDASVTDSGGPADGGVDAGGRACAGTLLDDVCWYLSAVNQSCNQTCSTRGGFDSASLAFIGTTQQGGSVEQCARVFDVLLGAGAVQAGTRTDAGAGCHVFANDD